MTEPHAPVIPYAHIRDLRELPESPDSSQLIHGFRIQTHLLSYENFRTLQTEIQQRNGSEWLPGKKHESQRRCGTNAA